MLGLQTQERCVENDRIANKQPTAIRLHHLAPRSTARLHKLQGISKATHAIAKKKQQQAIRPGSATASLQLLFGNKQTNSK